MKRAGWSKFLFLFAVSSVCALVSPSESMAESASAPFLYCKFRNWVVDIDSVLDHTLGVQNRTCSFTLDDKTYHEQGVGACLYRQWRAAFFRNKVGVVKVQIENLVHPDRPVSFTVLSRPVSMWEPQTGDFRPWRAVTRYRDFYFHLRIDEATPAAEWLRYPELLQPITGQRDARLSDIALVVDSTKEEVDGITMKAVGHINFYVENQQEKPIYSAHFSTNWGLLSGGPAAEAPLRPSPNGCSEPTPLKLLGFEIGFEKRPFDTRLEAK